MLSGSRAQTGQGEIMTGLPHIPIVVKVQTSMIFTHCKCGRPLPLHSPGCPVVDAALAMVEIFPGSMSWAGWVEHLLLGIASVLSDDQPVLIAYMSPEQTFIVSHHEAARMDRSLARWQL